MCEVVRLPPFACAQRFCRKRLSVVEGISGSLIIHSASGLAAGEKLGLEKFL
jgi:hypothetical protein